MNNPAFPRNHHATGGKRRRDERQAFLSSLDYLSTDSAGHTAKSSVLAASMVTIAVRKCTSSRIDQPNADMVETTAPTVCSRRHDRYSHGRWDHKLPEVAARVTDAAPNLFRSLMRYHDTNKTTTPNSVSPATWFGGITRITQIKAVQLIAVMLQAFFHRPRFHGPRSTHVCARHARQPR